MSSRLAVIGGVLVGVLLVLAVGVAFFLLAPPVANRVPPTPLLPTRSPSAPAPSGTARNTPSAAGTGSAPSAGAPGGSAATSTAFHVGQPAPSLRLPQLGGGTIDLAALRGKPVWVYFMATWCPSCQDEFPLMNGFAARYADRGLVVLAVDVRESEATVRAFATRMNAIFPLALDQAGSAQDAWGVIGLPVHFWIDTRGVVRDGALGGIGPDVMAGGLGTIMPGVSVTP